MKRTVPLVLAVLGLGLLAGCGNGAAAAGGELSSVTLRVGATGYAAQQAALEVAGLDATPYKVEWKVFTGGDKQMQAIQAGALDVANASEIPPVFAAAQVGPKWKAVITGRASTLLQEVNVGKGSTLRTIGDLKGRKVGYVQNTTAQYFLLKLLEQAGLSWSDIQPVPLLPKDGVAALQGGSIDAFANYGNSVIAIKQSGGRTLGSGQDILSGNFVYLTSDKVLADGTARAAVADLFARINKAYAVIRAGRQQQYAQRVSAATQQPVDQALSQFLAQEKQRPTAYLPAGPAAVTSQQTVADAFTQLGAIPRVDVSRFWSEALNGDLTAALARYPTGDPAAASPSP